MNRKASERVAAEFLNPTTASSLMWDALSERSTRRTMEEVIIFDDGDMTGSDIVSFETGDTVTTTEAGQLKPGVTLEIKDTMIVNGFAQYLAGGVWHKAGDLK